MTERRSRWLAWIVVVLLAPVAIAASPLGPLLVGPLVGVATHQQRGHDVPFEKGTGPGSVVSARTMPHLTLALRLRARAVRVTYRSTDEHGRTSVVSGSVFTPRGRAPRGGWPVIALGHASTGIAYSCAPSLSPNLLGSAGAVGTYVRRGYAVALPDYQGLGAPGAHPYLDAAVAGRNLIDAVRALRAVFPDASTRWLAAGLSQGGGAAWSANEQESTYGEGLDLVGSVSISPAADMTGLATGDVAGTLPVTQRPLLQWVIASLARTQQGFDVDDYRTPAVAKSWRLLSECGAEDIAARTSAMLRIGPLDLRPRTPAAATELVDVMRARALPQRRASAPMLVVYGTADQYVTPAWTTAAVARARALGDDITADLQPGRGHLDVDTSSVQPWIDQRFGR